MEEIIKDTLSGFITESLYDATSALLETLHIELDRESADPMQITDFLDSDIPLYLKEAIKSIDKTYFVGIVNDRSLDGYKDNTSLEEVEEEMREHKGKYDGMFIFACEAKSNTELTRSTISAITRALNRVALANPVILFFRQGKKISLATCERMDYNQLWKQGTSEKLGKVNILRNINCEDPHRGHVDILASLGDKRYATFEELYKHWFEVFSSELLTKKFYNELSDWYAWAVQIAKFPNDIRTTEDDAKFNHESCIRLITRLIFVWFLKRKHLIPEEFFEEDYIREHFIENFDPHDKQSLMYNAEESKYYRLIIQNLFFAMLNCPIVAEGKKTPNNRRFRGNGQLGYKRDGYNVNNLMRYKSEFMDGGADEFVKLANSSVPFLNGGLFDCLDDKPRGLYYDGFSERKESLAQLYFPDYLFFGEEVGDGIDLSEWYGDKNKKKVSARGIIDILKRYSFTVEENTPYDQEVSLDPELLGKVFENLLAAFNPETQTSARKQTGSFYTPREIVQYMVNESLVAHLKRMCGDEQESLYRSLLNYSNDDISLTKEQCKNIMHALYNCRVLDPACGSGAFPMGILQQMVHILKRIDPTNEMWNSMMVDIAIEEARKELEKVASNNEAEKAKIEENRKARLDDIESAFNESVNDPDYARKLYLIEHCIYGVDIQPIATQISKLRFFISLVVDQNPTDDAKSNFGIRPLPNLEAKFVTANTLIPLDRTKNLFTNSDEVRYYEDLLQEINHRIFLAKKNTEKEALRQKMIDTRMAMATMMSTEGFLGDKGYGQLMGWNMFDQNASAPFFDSEWMFGVKGGFDVVIGNPPYGAGLSKSEKEFYKRCYQTAKTIKGLQKGSLDTYTLFIERGYNCVKKNGYMTYIIPISITSSDSLTGVHRLLYDNCETIRVSSYAVRPQPVFKNATVNTSIISYTKTLSEIKEVYSTKMYRKGANFNLQTLIDNLEFAEVSKYLKVGRIPKISSALEESILSKIIILPQISSYKNCLGSPIYYRTTGGRYFKVVTDYSTGSTKEKPIFFDNKYYRAIGCALSSNLSFWFYQIYSNNLDWKSVEIESFPIPKFTDEQINCLNDLYSEYCNDIEKNANSRTSSGESKYNVEVFKEYKIVRSKKIIDKIDDFIGPLYGLTKDEIEFVKNYELEFRMAGDD